MNGTMRETPPRASAPPPATLLEVPPAAAASRALPDGGVALAAVILVALGLALMWVVRMPMFQSADESAHADYAFTLYATRAPVSLRGRVQGTNVHPVVRYLERASGFGTMRINPDGRVPAGYGTRAFFASVDAAAPSVPGDFLERNGRRVPFVAVSYSALYYALDAVAIGVGAWLSHGSATAEFFAARGFNVLLLLCSLLLSYGILRELRFGYWSALGILATLGFFPLTSWVSAYVQPDNLSFTAVSLVLYLALRTRDAPGDARGTFALGVALALLALTKAQYFVAVAVPVLAYRTFRFARARRAARAWAFFAGLLLGPAVAAGLWVRASLAGADQTLATRGASFANPIADAARHGLFALLRELTASSAAAFADFFFKGFTFYGYWGEFSWIGTQIGFGPATDFVYALVSAGSLVVAVLVGGGLLLNTWPRIARVALRRGLPTAADLLLRELPLNAYLLFIALMLALYVGTDGQLAGAGRYWLPVILCSLLCAVRYGPRGLPRRLRAPFARGLGGAALAFSVASAAASPAALEARFYAPPAAPGTTETWALVQHFGDNRVTKFDDPRTFTLPARGALAVSGVAIDSRSMLPARYVDLAVDGKAVARAVTGSPQPQTANLLHDDALLPSGFRATLDLGRLAPGPHELRLLVGERNRAAPYPSVARIHFTIHG